MPRNSIHTSRRKAMTTSPTRTTPFIGQTAQLSRTVGDNDIALFTEISGLLHDGYRHQDRTLTSHCGTAAPLNDRRNPHRAQALALGALPRRSRRPRQFQVQNGGVYPVPTPRASGKGLRRAELLAAIS